MNLTAVILIIVAIIAIVLIVLYFAIERGEGRFTFDIGGAGPHAEGGTDTSSDTGFKGRLTGLGVFAVGVIGVLTARLWSMQLVSSDDYTGLRRIAPVPSPPMPPVAAYSTATVPSSSPIAPPSL